jgi:nucleoid-associated protein YgaU
METLEMELFLDTWEAHDEDGRALNRARDDVRDLTRKITDFMNIDRATHAPPVLLFTWASLSFTCVLARASQKFVMFLDDGTPVRARLNVTFNGYRNPEMEAKHVKRETADYSKVHVVMQGETLSSIAYKTYRNPLLWRPIAQANDVDDPRRLAVGARLLVPQLPYRDPQTGEIYSGESYSGEIYSGEVHT